jgi:hypothetical protein
MPLVAPYAGQDQQSRINVPATIAYKYPPFSPAEESCWVMPAYAQVFGIPAQPDARGWVPPPLVKTDLWSAMQTYPL